MIKFTTTVDDEDYNIEQHEELPGLFSVIHKSGVHKLAKNQTTGNWKCIEYRIGTDPINLEKFYEIIDNELNNEG